MFLCSNFLRIFRTNILIRTETIHRRIGAETIHHRVETIHRRRRVEWPPIRGIKNHKYFFRSKLFIFLLFLNFHIFSFFTGFIFLNLPAFITYHFINITGFTFLTISFWIHTHSVFVCLGVKTVQEQKFVEISTTTFIPVFTGNLREKRNFLRFLQISPLVPFFTPIYAVCNN